MWGTFNECYNSTYYRPQYITEGRGSGSYAFHIPKSLKTKSRHTCHSHTWLIQSLTLIKWLECIRNPTPNVLIVEGYYSDYHLCTLKLAQIYWTTKKEPIVTLNMWIYSDLQYFKELHNTKYLKDIFLRVRKIYHSTCKLERTLLKENHISKEKSRNK